MSFNVKRTKYIYTLTSSQAWMSGFSLPLPYLSSFLLLSFPTTMFEPSLDKGAGSDRDVQPRARTVFNTLLSYVGPYEFLIIQLYRKLHHHSSC